MKKILAIEFVLSVFAAGALGNTNVEWGVEAPNLNDSSYAIECYIEPLGRDRLTPGNQAIAYYNQGNSYSKQGNFSRAIREYTKAIELNPEFVKAYYNRGNAYGCQGNFARAIQDYTKAIELDPKYEKAYNNRGNAYGKQCQFALAIRDCNKAIALNPKIAKAYYNRGHAYACQGSFAKAIRDYTKAIELNPKYQKACTGIAWLYATAKNRSYRNGQKAVSFATKALSFGETLGGIATLAAAYIENGQSQKAIETYNQVIRKDKSRIEKYQRFLKEEGYYTGGIDGIAGPKFQQAVKACVMAGQYIDIDSFYYFSTECKRGIP